MADDEIPITQVMVDEVQSLLSLFGGEAISEALQALSVARRAHDAIVRVKYGEATPEMVADLLAELDTASTCLADFAMELYDIIEMHAPGQPPDETEITQQEKPT